MKTAQAVLGHTDARVTLELYARVVTEQQRKAADTMVAASGRARTAPLKGAARRPASAPPLAAPS